MLLSSAKASAPIWGTGFEGHEEQESSKDDVASWEAGSREIQRDVHPQKRSWAGRVRRAVL